MSILATAVLDPKIFAGAAGGESQLANHLLRRAWSHGWAWRRFCFGAFPHSDCGFAGRWRGRFLRRFFCARPDQAPRLRFYRLGQVSASQKSVSLEGTAKPSGHITEYDHVGKGGAGDAFAKPAYDDFYNTRNSGGYAENIGPLGQRDGFTTGHYTGGSFYRGFGAAGGGDQKSTLYYLTQHLPQGYHLAGYYTTHTYKDPSRLIGDAAKFRGNFGIDPYITMRSPDRNSNYDHAVNSYYPEPNGGP